MFCFCFDFLVLFLSILKNSFVLLFFCVVLFCHKTKWSSCVHLVVFLPFLFVVCFEFCLFLVFFHSSQKRPPKNLTQQKPKKTKMQKNWTKKIAQLCSQIVFFNFWGWR